MALTNSRSLQISMADSEALHNTTSPSFQFDSLNFGGAAGIGTGNIGISLPGGNNSNNNSNDNNNNANNNNNPDAGANSNTAENIDINTLAMFRRMSEAVGTLDLIPPMGQNLNDITQFPADLSLPIPLDDTNFASGRATSDPLQLSTAVSAATQKKDTSTNSNSNSNNSTTTAAAKKSDNPLLEVSKLIPVTGERPLPDDKSYALDDDVLFEVFGVLWEQDQAQQGMTVKQICDHLLTKRPEMSSLSTKLSNLISAKLNAYVKKIEKGEVTLKYAISREWSNSSPRRMLYIYRGILAPDYKEHALRVTNRLKQQQAELNGDSARGNAGITADVTKNSSSINNNNNGGWTDSGNHSSSAKRSSGNGKGNRSNNGNNGSKHGGNGRTKAGDTSLGHNNISTDTTFSLNVDFNVPYASSPVSVNLNSYVDPSPVPGLGNVNMIQQGTTTVGDSGVDSVANNSTNTSHAKSVKLSGKKVTNKTNSSVKSGTNNNLPGTSDEVVQDTDDNQSQTRKRMTPEDSREPEHHSKGTGDGGGGGSGTNTKRRKSTQGTPDSTTNSTAEAVVNGAVSNTSNATDSLGDSLELNDVSDRSGTSSSATYITAVAATPRISKFLPRSGLRGVGVGFGGTLGVVGSVNSNPISSSNPGLNNSGSNLVSMFHRFVSTQTPISRESESGASPDQDSAGSTTGSTALETDSSTGSNVSGGLSKTRGSEVINQSWMKVVREGFLIQDIEPPESISSERLDDII